LRQRPAPCSRQVRGRPRISGYLGKTDALEQAIGEFALTYADQTVRDRAALVEEDP
jgi:hypothetical protein